ncbi:MULTISPECIES: hypothetical protein [unclassified Ruminococcus]|uniref:hypothetical protein n=1 Tax=unclassified Ruminococcus TaxID=2608920 RepID=UPI0021086EBB|nr:MULTISPECIES: hypothetical protein [unclassified Ruminococcus]MCQ4022269.1 hypothetical protein [Ruminococcus sp. zg-924]MCQ4114597.1 hypothetical protein [Ruminococcus sp. zg-921]
MSLFDDFFTNAKSAVNAVGKKAEKVIDVSKLKYAEAGLQSEINKKCQALGKFVYDSYLSGEMDKDALSDKIDELKELNENLESTRKLINAQKNKVVCNACGALVSADLQYCGKCGAKLYSDDPASPTSDNSCENDDPVSRDAQQAVKEAQEDAVQ